MTGWRAPQRPARSRRPDGGRACPDDDHLPDALALAALDAGGVEAGLMAVLRLVGERAGWSAGTAWLPDRDGPLRLGAAGGAHGFADPAAFAAEVLAGQRPLSRARDDRAEHGLPITSLGQPVAALLFTAPAAAAGPGALPALVEAVRRLGPLLQGRIAAAAQARTEARLRGVLDAAPDAMLVVDRGGRVVYANAQAERLFATPRAVLVGAPVDALVPAPVRAGHAEHLARLFGAPAARPMGGGPDLVAIAADGREIPVEISLAPHESDDGLLFSAAIRDVSERRRAEQELRASLREKELLLREIHHRVKNNLQLVSSLLSLQARELGSSELQSVVEKTQHRIAAISMIHDALDRGDADLAGYLGRLVRNLVAAHAGATDQKIDLGLELEPVRVAVDQAIPCGLIANELVDNSLTHGLAGRARGALAVGLRRSGDEVELTVGDDGPGFPAGIDPERDGRLGLELVRTLARQLSGALTFAGARASLRFRPARPPRRDR
jgi:PAS domain S-box-containing protein